MAAATSQEGASNICREWQLFHRVRCYSDILLDLNCFVNRELVYIKSAMKSLARILTHAYYLKLGHLFIYRYKEQNDPRMDESKVQC